MTRKTSPQRRAAFLAALRATGNQTLAAERAKVSRSWVHLHRSGDPEFDAAVREAIKEARQSFDPSTGSGQAGWGGSGKPPRGWAYLDGEELVVRGSGGSVLRDAAGAAPQDERVGRRVQIARARLRQWTPRAEARFLATLAATCNVKAACAEAGLSVPSAYRHRERWPAFAARWDEALAAGCMALEAALLEAGANFLSAREAAPLDASDALDPAPAFAGMDAHQALHLLYMHKHHQPRPGRLPGGRRAGGRRRS